MPLSDQAAPEITTAESKPLSPSPNWDPVRRVLIMHRGERDPGSSYEDIAPEPAPPEQPERGTAGRANGRPRRRRQRSG